MHPQERLISGRYRLLVPAGSDALGILWQAHDEQRRTDVWVRELLLPAHLSPAERAAIAARVAAQARGAAVLSHPSFLPVLDVTEDAGGVFVVTRAVPGQNLRQLVAATGPLSPDRAARLGLSILAALDAAHTLGMVHDGVSPSTVYVKADDDVVLTDFGLAATTEVATGTPASGGPGEATLSGPARDLFDLGGTLYFAVEGVEAAYPRPAPKRAGALTPVLHGLLVLSPAQRWNSTQVASSLREVAGSADPVPTPDPTPGGAPAAGGAPVSGDGPAAGGAPVSGGGPVSGGAVAGGSAAAGAVPTSAAAASAGVPTSAAAAVSADPLDSAPLPETVAGPVRGGPPRVEPLANSPAEVPPGPPYPPPPATLPPLAVPSPVGPPPTGSPVGSAPGYRGNTGGFPVVPAPGSPSAPPMSAPAGYPYPPRRGRPRWVWVVTGVAVVAFLAVASVGVVMLNKSENRAGSTVATAGPTKPGAAAVPITLTLTVGGDTGYDELINEYQKDNPAVTVRLRKLPPEEQARLGSQGDVGDVLMLNEEHFWRVSQQVPFVDLVPLVGNARADYLPWAYEFGQTADGQLYGLPADVGGMSLCYRKDLFRAAGLPQDRAAVGQLWNNWDAFVATGRRYRQQSGKPMLDNVTSVYNTLVLQLGEPIYFDRSDTLVAATSPSVRVAWTRAVQLYAEGISARLEASSSAWSNGLSGGGFAVTACNAAMFQLIRMTGPANQGLWDVAPIPGGSGNAGGNWLAVPRASRHPAEAAALARFLTSARSQSTAIRETGTVPSNLAALAEPVPPGTLGRYFSNAPVGEILADSVRGLKPVYRGPKYQDVSTFAFEAALAAMENGRMTPEVAWQQALDEAQRRAG